MSKTIVVVIIIFISVLSYAQNKEGYTVETSGASISQQKEDQSEYYEQYRGVFIKSKLSPTISLLAGLNKSRIGDNDFLEFPLLFQYQAIPQLKLFAGPQLEAMRDRTTGATKLRKKSFTIGATYDFTRNWDASIQFLQPMNQTGNIEKINLLTPNKIRFRTGIKF